MFLICPYCDTEIVDEDATFCSNCGKSLASEGEQQCEPFQVQEKQSDLMLVAAVLTIIAATLSAGLGYIGLYRYVSFVDYYDFSILLGFLIMAAIDFFVSAFAMAGSIFILKRKRIKFSMIGVALLLVSVVVNYMIIQYYQYGFTDIIVMSEVAILIFSILSGVIVTTKAEFD